MLGLQLGCFDTNQRKCNANTKVMTINTVVYNPSCYTDQWIHLHSQLHYWVVAIIMVVTVGSGWIKSFLLVDILHDHIMFEWLLNCVIDVFLILLSFVLKSRWVCVFVRDADTMVHNGIDVHCFVLILHFQHGMRCISFVCMMIAFCMMIILTCDDCVIEHDMSTSSTSCVSVVEYHRCCDDDVDIKWNDDVHMIWTSLWHISLLYICLWWLQHVTLSSHHACWHNVNSWWILHLHVMWMLCMHITQMSSMSTSCWHHIEYIKSTTWQHHTSTYDDILTYML